MTGTSGLVGEEERERRCWPSSPSNNVQQGPSAPRSSIISHLTSCSRVGRLVESLHLTIRADHLPHSEQHISLVLSPADTKSCQIVHQSLIYIILGRQLSQSRDGPNRPPRIHLPSVHPPPPPNPHRHPSSPLHPLPPPRTFAIPSPPRPIRAFPMGQYLPPARVAANATLVGDLRRDLHSIQRNCSLCRRRRV